MAEVDSRLASKHLLLLALLLDGVRSWLLVVIIIVVVVIHSTKFDDRDGDDAMMFMFMYV